MLKCIGKGSGNYDKIYSNSFSNYLQTSFEICSYFFLYEMLLLKKIERSINFFLIFKYFVKNLTSLFHFKLRPDFLAH